MAHSNQERYSELVLEKLRASVMLKNGIVFNTSYEGSPKAGVVKIPTRDTEVSVSAYNKSSGINISSGSTSYTSLSIDKDYAVNEIIDGFDAETVPDGIIAERLDSGADSLARQQDSDGAATLISGSTKINEKATVDGNFNEKPEDAYRLLIEIRKKMTKANVPNDGKRYLLATPDFYALMLLDEKHFIPASALGDDIKKTGAVGKIAGFNVYEWNNSTVGLRAIAGHPKYATRAEEFSVPVHIQDLSASGKYIGASAVQGRLVYGHAVLRSAAIYSLYTPELLSLTCAAGTTTAGNTLIDVTGGYTGATKTTNTYRARVLSGEKVSFGDTVASDTAGWTTLGTVGTTQLSGTSEGDTVEVVEVVSDKVVAAGYIKAVPYSA